MRVGTGLDSIAVKRYVIFTSTPLSSGQRHISIGWQMTGRQLSSQMNQSSTYSDWMVVAGVGGSLENSLMNAM